METEQERDVGIERQGFSEPFLESAPPTISDADANLRWPRDREQVRLLYQRYAMDIEEALPQWHATMHFTANQNVELDGDRGCVET